MYKRYVVTFVDMQEWTIKSDIIQSTDWKTALLHHSKIEPFADSVEKYGACNSFYGAQDYAQTQDCLIDMTCVQGDSDL